jgi:hypothetical protein
MDGGCLEQWAAVQGLQHECTQHRSTFPPMPQGQKVLVLKLLRMASMTLETWDATVGVSRMWVGDSETRNPLVQPKRES